MRKQWRYAIVCTFICMMAILMQPTQVEAATQSERNAYRAVFDATYYYNTYPDVAAAFGMNEQALFNHFVEFGVNEGRSASAEFNPQAYRQRYADLQQAFGSDMAAYCQHYVAFGRSEGRAASSDGQVMVAVSQSQPAAQSQAAQSQSAVQSQPTQSPSGTVTGTCTTSYEDNVSRAINVELAASRVNGVVVQPGQSFSFSRTILPRTTENGYVTGPIFVGGKESTGIGGGVCQVSSTLYAAMLSAGLPATERHAHSLPVDYLPAGYDATIAGNYKDLKFVNTFSQPVMIQANAEGGVLTVSLVLM